MTTSGPQDSPAWPPVQSAAPAASHGVQDRRNPPATVTPTPATTAATTAATLPATPPATPTAYPPNERRPRHPRRIALAAVGALVLAGAGTAVALAGPHIEQTDVLTHTISALTVDAGNGDVTVHTGGQPGTVQVTRTTRGTSLPALGPGSWQGNTLALDCGNTCNVSYDIRVPDNVTVVARTDSGDVDLDGAPASVSVTTGSGDVDARVATDSLTTRSNSGDTKLRLGNAPRLLKATAESGDVEVRLPDGQTYAVDAHTASGDTEIDIPRQDTADHRVEVSTGSGDIEVRSR